MVNEIQYAPTSPEPEWIELYNITDNDIIFEKFTVADYATTTDPITLEIPAYGFIVITEKKSELLKIYDIDSSLVIESDLPTFNNTDDLVLIANNVKMIDSVKYNSKWGVKGNSLERRRYFEFENDSTNWGASEVSGTPTKINSIAAYYDLEIIDATLVPAGFRIILENKGNITSLQGRIDLEINDNLVTFYQIDSIAAFSDKEIILDQTIIGYTPKIKDKLRFIVKTNEMMITSNS